MEVICLAAGRLISHKEPKLPELESSNAVLITIILYSIPLFSDICVQVLKRVILVGWLNEQGYRTRNMHKLQGPDGNLTSGPRLFATASVAFLQKGEKGIAAPYHS